MSINTFIETLKEQPITDVYMAIEALSDDPTERWAKLEGGPVIFCFDDSCVVLRQPIGSEDISCERLLLSEWSAWARKEYPDCRTGLMRIFENVCYRKNLDDAPPRVTKVTTFEQGNTKKLGGLLIDFSTGGSIGLDASSYGGLVWFLNEQLPIFRSEYAAIVPLHEEVVWQQ